MRRARYGWRVCSSSNCCRRWRRWRRRERRGGDESGDDGGGEETLQADSQLLPPLQTLCDETCGETAERLLLPSLRPQRNAPSLSLTPPLCYGSSGEEPGICTDDSLLCSWHV
ncbi:hypothetical protein GBAR_LOCUS27753 [Geodia barretti]|uniref:Uncharacterized protein n=1 Tax=Geodia barretti TaxID=519541 RepID=A0AA35XFK1_GEOBA|nr:hypothetical protein GBAR_LOCUS27753 [Geodia barretti]